MILGNECRIDDCGLNGDPRTHKGVNLHGIYLDGSDGRGPEKSTDATCLRQSQILTMAASAIAEAEADWPVHRFVHSRQLEMQGMDLEIGFPPETK